MAVLSKLFVNRLGFDPLHASCYETTHVWNPNCYGAIWDATPGGFLFCLKTYASFYILTALIAKKGDVRKINWQHLARNVAQSSVFLTSNMIFYLWFMCKIRHLLGFFIWPTLGYTNGILASYLAILLEHPKRRPALMLYLTNLASETVYRQLANHGYVPMIPSGQCIPFMIGLALFFYLQTQGRLHKSYSDIFDKLYGNAKNVDHLDLRKLPEGLREFLQDLRVKFDKHALCEHRHSCVSNAAEATFKNFGVGLGVSSVLTLLKNLKNIVKSPSTVLKQLISTENFKIPLFFAGLPLLFHSTSCLINRGGERTKKYAPIAAGATSGLAMLAFPNVSIAMYTLWKAIEANYIDLADRGIIPYVKHGDALLYALSTGYVLGCACIEPHAMRKGYYNFLMGLTGGRLALFNRRLFDKYGFQTSKMFPDYIPDLDSKHCVINPALYMPSH